MDIMIKGSVVFQNKCISKKELTKLTEQIKTLVRNSQINKTDIVAIALSRTPLLIATIFALLQEDIVFVPIDLEFPQERLQYMLGQANVKMIITDKKGNIGINSYVERESNNDLKLRVLVNKSQVGFMYDDKKLAYILFTSGTTGMPKAVEVLRNSLLNFIDAIPKVVKFPQRATIGCFTNQTFDIFFLETIMALNKDMKVVLANEKERINPRRIREIIRESNLNTLQLTPSALIMLKTIDNNYECLKGVETMLVGGESFPLTLLQELQKVIKGRIYNMYGPTETTIWSTVSDLTTSNEIHIGKPISNTSLLILDENLECCPINCIGEIFIMGKGVAKGYRNNLKLTSERFINIDYNGKKVRGYRTGDFGFIDCKGNCHFSGRRDEQIKIRGHRIEIGDIEENLRKIKGIKNAIVAIDSQDNKQLVCFYLTEDACSVENIRNEAKNILPSYMIPNRWICVSEIFLTSSNKADRQKMMEIYLSDKNVNVPTDQGQDIVFCKIKKYLREENEKIELSDKFEDIDMDSIKYIQFIVAIEEEFQLEFGDEVLNKEYFVTIKDFVDYVKNIMDK